MSYQSQIFEVMITSEEYDALVQDNRQLKEQQNRFIQEQEEFKKRIEKLESCAAQNDGLKDIIKRMSREVIKLARKNTEIEEELLRQNQLQADISREELAHLQEQLEKNMQQVRALAEINEQMKTQIEADIPLIAQGNSLKLEVHYLKEEIQKRDYLIINERNIMEKREQALKEKELAFQSTKQQVELLKTQLEKEKQDIKIEWDQKETEMVQQFIKRENDLEDEYQKRRVQLQAEYERRIASIKDFATCLELEENNTNLSRQLENLRQQLSEHQQNIRAMHAKQEEYKKAINMHKKNNIQLRIEIQGLKQRMIQVKKEKEPQHIDHQIIEYFSTFILLFQSKLQEAGETKIKEQLDNKKAAMFKALEREYHKIVASQDKPIRKSSF